GLAGCAHLTAIHQEQRHATQHLRQPAGDERHAASQAMIDTTQIRGDADMKVLVFVKATKGSENGEMPTEHLLSEMMAYNEERVKAGIMRGGDGLKPSSEGVRVRFSGKDRTVINGPFPETSELVAGYWEWEVKSMQEAIDWVKRCPNPMMETSEIEIRPLYAPEDFGEALTPELKEDWQRLQAESEKLAKQ